ncbi:hypothetical protein DL89DRAFT_297135 [Linderina pennispora]|uniref:Oxidoreductase N-terminal domain-containing protein n=1 Tax=Linderina pennispora TaxID=61395 RepID=A0A1Y1VUE4_9FUNG|nr:uncharacterized protein DL89DRAFT_297135 [Linderina pennispora]ORX64625.1 hypothetical protein DL89DRAFT_297135 [Linderina pennispora]
MSNSRINIRILANKFSPSGLASLDSFKIATEPAPTKDSLKENQVLIRTLYLSIDPYQRGRLTGATDSYASTSAGSAGGDIVSTPDASWESFSVVDAAFNYKTCGNFIEAIKRIDPEGVDIYYDNVGGEFLDAALANINTGAP